MPLGFTCLHVSGLPKWMDGYIYKVYWGDKFEDECIAILGLVEEMKRERERQRGRAGGKEVVEEGVLYQY